MPTINIIGAGLAGSEAAYQLAKRGIQVRLFEMRPTQLTPAHRTGGLAELVCSNSFKSTLLSTAHGAFKQELSELGSLLMQVAPKARVPAGESLAVDRTVFSREIENAIVETQNVERITKKIESLDDLPPAEATIIATGPLTQGGLAEFMRSFTQNESLYFYDAIAPVVDASSINRNIAFSASRYGKGSDDYLNCPMSEEEYHRFYNALMTAEKLDFHDFEDAKYFQGCQPIEAIAETGKDTLRFGPMKPVGLVDPRTNQQPYAVVQLRIDNLNRTAYNMVGFQTKLKYGEQTKIFKMIPGLENAEFLRLGSMHRNTYICSPLLLDKNFALKKKQNIRIAGQITGVEGYTESSAIGLVVAMSLWCELTAHNWTLPPTNSFLGALCRYLFESNPKDFQPINVHFGLFSEEIMSSVSKKIDGKRLSKQEIRTLLSKQAVAIIQKWRHQIGW